jgi:general secretion pathway protein C
MSAPSKFSVRAPQIVMVVLTFATALQLAHWITGRSGARTPSAAALTPTRAANRPAVDLAAISAAQLFGPLANTAMPTGSADPDHAPPTSLPLVLAGVFARTDPQAGYAIVGETAANARLHAVGAALPGGATLKAVYPDRVLLEHNGGYETLTLPQRAAPWAGTAAASPGPGPAAQLDRARDVLARNPNAIGQALRWQQVLADGATRGFRVYPGSNEKVFKALGLKPGDLLTALNQVPLDGAARGEEIMGTLASAGRVTVTLSREGREQNLTLDIEQALRSVETQTPEPNSPIVADERARAERRPGE